MPPFQSWGWLEQALGLPAPCREDWPGVHTMPHPHCRTQWLFATLLRQPPGTCPQSLSSLTVSLEFRWPSLADLLTSRVNTSQQYRGAGWKQT